jgi:hypothetical protein
MPSCRAIKDACGDRTPNDKEGVGKDGVVKELATFVRAAAAKWAPCRHYLFHVGVRRTVHTVLLCAARIDGIRRQQQQQLELQLQLQLEGGGTACGGLCADEKDQKDEDEEEEEEGGGGEEGEEDKENQGPPSKRRRKMQPPTTSRRRKSNPAKLSNTPTPLQQPVHGRVKGQGALQEEGALAYLPTEIWHSILSHLRRADHLPTHSTAL